MIIEQLLYLGYPTKVAIDSRLDVNDCSPFEPFYNENTGSLMFFMLSYSLKSVAKRYLGITIDKSIRGQIIWRGLDEDTIRYSAGDVTYLESILYAQMKECQRKQCVEAARIECNFVPVIAYLEWCGIKLDETK